MFTFLQKYSWEQVLFFLIAILGILLFSFNILEVPLTIDELNAIERSNFNSLSDLFNDSISTDSHPPLIQIFLYYWLKIVGYNIFLIKLPFLMMGISSIFILYKLAKEWFNKNVALLTASFFVSIQFTIMYAQIARPYIAGVFLSLLLAYHWTKLIQGNSKLKNYFWYVFFGLMLAHTHYFGTLQTATIGALGLFFIPKNKFKSYFIANSILLLLFIPYLPYLQLQLNIEGMSYLSTPDIFYLFNYVFYLFQYSYLAVLLVLGIISFSIFAIKKIPYTQFSLVAFILFATPLTIGYLFSVLVRPVMPYRALIFSFPFLLLLLFSFCSPLKKRFVLLFCSLILSVNIYTLLQNRNHYQIFHKGIVSAAVNETKSILEKGTNPFIIFNTPEFNVQFYQKELHTNFTYWNIYASDLTPIAFRKKIQTLDYQSIAAFNLSDNYISIIREFFPLQKIVDNGFTYSYSLFSKDTKIASKGLIYSKTQNFEDDETSKQLLVESNNNTFYHFNEGQEWGPSLTIPIGEIVPNNFTIIESSISLLSDHPMMKGLLVVEINDNKKSIAWRSSDTKKWIDNSAQWQTIHYSIQLNEILKPYQLTKNSVLKVYFWNQNKTRVSIDNISIKVFKGNAKVYSLLENFPNENTY
jgi:hypothetical protein